MKYLCLTTLVVAVFMLTFFKATCLELTTTSNMAVNNLRDSDFIALHGNWLNIPEFSSYKLKVEPRNDVLQKMNIIVNGYIKRDDSDKRSPYQIYSKTHVVQDGAMNSTHFFDSNMEQYNTQQCNKKECTNYELEDVISIPFHQIIKSYEKKSFIAKQHVKFYDRVTDDLCNSNEYDLIVTHFHEQHFLLCLLKEKRSIDALKYIVGREFIATVVSFAPSTISESLDMFKHETNKFPKKKKAIKSEPTLSSNTNSRAIQETLPQSAYFFNPQAHACILPWLKGKNCNGVASKRSSQQLKRCVFLHGFGTDSSKTGYPVSASKQFQNGEYWGNIDAYTPNCGERIFMREETLMRGWDDLSLQLAVSRILVPNFVWDQGNNTNGTNPNVVRNTIIFAHSMGNLMVAGAIRNGLISIEKYSTSWYNIMGPIRGSPMADKGVELCSNWFVDFVAPLKRYGLCLAFGQPTNGLKSLTSTADYDGKISEIVSRYVTGTMCGTRSSGLYPTSGMSVMMAGVSTTIMGQYTHDGAVPYYSCMNGASNFAQNYKNANYEVWVNHFDGTCLNGDGWFSSTSPCSYYLNKY